MSRTSLSRNINLVVLTTQQAAFVKVQALLWTMSMDVLRKPYAQPPEQ